MTRSVFVDAAAWIALLDKSDSLRPQAIAAMVEIRRTRTPLVTTEFVLIEVANGYSHPPARSHAIQFLDTLRERDDLTIFPATSDWMREGWKLYGSRPDKSWSLTDCISFGVMSREGLSKALTSDHHFEQAGFVRLLKP